MGGNLFDGKGVERGFGGFGRLDLPGMGRWISLEDVGFML